MAVTALALMYQWAETTRMARGRGMLAPKALQASVYRLWSSAFIGLPWPKNTAGMRRLPLEPVVSFICNFHPDGPSSHRQSVPHDWRGALSHEQGACPAAAMGPSLLSSSYRRPA